MNKLISFLTIGVVAISATAPIAAIKVSPDEALNRINSAKKISQKMNLQKSSLALAKVVEDKHGNEEALYIFNSTDANGFVVLPADDAFPAVLGYSDIGIYNVENPNPGVEWLLGRYADQIEYARDHHISRAATRSGDGCDDKTPIEPLIKSQWDQVSPFNRSVPVTRVNGARHSASGCVATALAQIMYYYKYPSVGSGTCSATWAGGTVTEDLSSLPFDWDNMIDRYEKGNFTDEQAQAVADLMYACGLAVKSSYATTTLAKTIMDVPALCENFGYSKELRYYYRDYVSTLEEWENLIYGSLSRQHPVAYAGGEENGGGHSFICDGYDGNGYFHINWGWGGDSDGYYLLDLLNPEEQGTGASAEGYNGRQYIITDIHPAAEGETSEYQHPIFYYRGDFVFNNGEKFNGNGSSTGFYNRTPYPVEFFWGIYIIDSQGYGSLKMKNTKVYDYGKGTTGMTFSTLGEDLGDGVYKIYPIYYANDDEDFTYIYHETGTNDYLVFTIEDNVITKVEPGYNAGNEPGAGIQTISGPMLSIALNSDGNGIYIRNISSAAEVCVYSISGERVLGPEHVSEDVTIDVENIPGGVYIVAVSDKQGQHKLKIIKK